MKRKVIKQGIDGLTIYLPKKWTEKRGVSAGDELNILEHEGKLILSQAQISQEKKTIELSIEGGRESKRRTVIVNSYRSGYDKIIVHYDKNPKDIQTVVSTFLVGFEVFHQSENTYIIESVAEPNFEDFSKIVEKIFFMLLDVLENLEEDSVENQVNQIQKQDNLLKRLLSKNILTVKAPFSLWHMLSSLTQVARQSHHLNKNVKKKFNKQEQELQKHSIEMLRILQKAYLKKDLNTLLMLHDMDTEIEIKANKIFKKGDALYTYYLVSICRQIYLTSSPLASIVESEQM